MEWFWDAYAPHKEDRTKTTASPLSATLEQLEGLPPALVIVDENDILRSRREAGDVTQEIIASPAPTLNQVIGDHLCKGHH